MKKLDLKWVSDVIGEDYKNWNDGDWVKIQAQAGSGKTYFITNKLIPTLEYNEKMLILCNRIALKRQMKLDLLKSMKSELPIKKTNEIDYEELDKMIDFGNVRIISYQTLGKQYKQEKYGVGHKYSLENYKYIVADECHFFYSDGKFNTDTEFALTQLFAEGRKSIKIFISATLGKLDNLIEKATLNLKVSFIKTNKLHKYETGTDYSYLNMNYFKKLKSLSTIINNDESGKKWLIFVNSDYERKQLCSLLKCDFEYINADRKNNKEFLNIINNSKFECKVLISTTVLYNGVNIKDDELTNLVLMCKDWTTFIQEIGRLRFKNINNEIYANETNLYLIIRSKKDFSKIVDKHKFVDEQIKLYKEDINRFNYKYSDFDRKTACKDYLNMIFRHNKEQKWEISNLGLDIYETEKKIISNIIDSFNNNYKITEEIREFYDGEYIGIPAYTFVEQELKWLYPDWENKDSNDYKIVIAEMLNFENKTIDNKIKVEEVEDLKVYLEKMFENKIVMLTKEDREPLVEKIGLYDINHGELFSGIDTLNGYLKDNNVPFRIKQFETSKMIAGKKKKFKYAWKLEKIEVTTY